MLQVLDGAIRDQGVLTTTTANTLGQNLGVYSGNWYGEPLGLGQCTTYQDWPYQTVWQSYPVYVSEDKTAKAIAILKALEADGVTSIVSVSAFIALVEKIVKLL